MTFEELPERAAFTWRDAFPDHCVYIKVGPREYRAFGSAYARAGFKWDPPLHHIDSDMIRGIEVDQAKRRVWRWSITKDSMDGDSDPPRAEGPRPEEVAAHEAQRDRLRARREADEAKAREMADAEKAAAAREAKP